MISRESSLLLNFLNLRVIINGKSIYQLEKKGSVAIGLKENRPNIVVTDGFHYTRPVMLTFKQLNVYYLQVVCAVSNDQIIAGILCMLLGGSVGMISGILVMKLIAFLPIL